MIDRSLDVKSLLDSVEKRINNGTVSYASDGVSHSFWLDGLDSGVGSSSEPINCVNLTLNQNLVKPSDPAEEDAFIIRRYEGSRPIGGFGVALPARDASEVVDAIVALLRAR